MGEGVASSSFTGQLGWGGRVLVLLFNVIQIARLRAESLFLLRGSVAGVRCGRRV